MRDSILGAIWLLFWPVLPSVAHAADPISVEVRSGASLRRGTPIRFVLPETLRGSDSFLLVSEDGAIRAVAERDPLEPEACSWILTAEIPPGTGVRYRLTALPDSTSEAPAAQARDEGSRQIGFLVRGREVFRYNHGLIDPPAGIEPIFARSGYIHPIRTPAGRIVSNDFPLNHKHHHGLWMPWTHATFEGREVNFWEQGYGLGKVECVGVVSRQSGKVGASLVARHRFLDLKAPGGEKEALHEVWRVRLWALDDPFLIDFESAQECAGESPLHLLTYRYGGFGFRGAASWEGEAGLEVLTSEGKTRLEGHATRARWCRLNGKVDGVEASIGFLCHPSNFRAPQAMRIHPSEPFFNFTPCPMGDFAIEPGKPYVSRYRVVVADGVISPEEMERLWNDYADPPEVLVVGS